MSQELETTYRFLHILAGITWIGLLYFFNFANLPLFKFNMKNPVEVDMAAKAGPDLSLKVLWWFRWGAMFTLIFGLALMDQVVRNAFGGDWGIYLDDPRGQTLALGAILGIIMWGNVWFIIWPNQRVILSNNKQIAAGVDDETKAAMEADNAPRVKKAVLASRFNTIASWPMLFFMVFAAHNPFMIW